MHLGKSILRHALTFIEVNGLELTISVIFPKVILRKLEFYFQLDEKLAVRTIIVPRYIITLLEQIQKFCHTFI